MRSADDHITRSIIDVAQKLADEHLFPSAQNVDRGGLIGSNRFEPLADAGLFGIGGPAELGQPGRADLGPSTMRRVMAAVASGCGATFFVWAQHHGVVRTVRSSTNEAVRSTLLPQLCAGQTIGGTAFAHLRRSDRRAVTASHTSNGWQLDGFAPWATSWGIAEVFTIAAETSDGQVVWVLIDATEQPGLTVTQLQLPVFGATGTVALHFDGLAVDDNRILAVITDADHWRRVDRERAAAGQTGVLGVVDRAITLLRAANRGDDDIAIATADRLGARLDEIWRRDDELVASLSNDPGEFDLGHASDHRAACLELGHHSTTALLAAIGGAAMSLDHPAQRLAREAAFYVIQAQTTDGRAATLRAAGS